MNPIRGVWHMTAIQVIEYFIRIQYYALSTLKQCTIWNINFRTMINVTYWFCIVAIFQYRVHVNFCAYLIAYHM